MAACAIATLYERKAPAHDRGPPIARRASIGDPRNTQIDQPGELGHEPNVGAVYAQQIDLSPGEHTLEITVINTGTAASATALATFTVAAEPPAPDGPIAPALDGLAGGDSFAEPSAAEFAGTAPTVTDVFVDSGVWASTFRSYLATNGLGDSGYRVPDGAEQLKNLPWNNVNKVSVRFSEAVTVTQDDLLVTGAAATLYDYAPGGFAYDAGTRTATWTFDRNVPSEKLQLQLRDSVTDGSGEQLDGEWTDGTDSFSSGDGAAGGNFNFRVNILPADVNQSGAVNANDEIEIRNRFFKSTTNPGSAPNT